MAELLTTGGQHLRLGELALLTGWEVVSSRDSYMGTVRESDPDHAIVQATLRYYVLGDRERSVFYAGCCWAFGDLHGMMGEPLDAPVLLGPVRDVTLEAGHDADEFEDWLLAGIGMSREGVPRLGGRSDAG
jgi:hypothetical protein